MHSLFALELVHQLFDLQSFCLWCWRSWRLVYLSLRSRFRHHLEDVSSKFRNCSWSARSRSCLIAGTWANFEWCHFVDLVSSQLEVLEPKYFLFSEAIGVLCCRCCIWCCKRQLEFTVYGALSAKPLSLIRSTLGSSHAQELLSKGSEMYQAYLTPLDLQTGDQKLPLRRIQESQAFHCPCPMFQGLLLLTPRAWPLRGLWWCRRCFLSLVSAPTWKSIWTGSTSDSDPRYSCYGFRYGWKLLHSFVLFHSFFIIKDKLNKLKQKNLELF